MNRFGVWKLVRPFHKLSITTYEKKKGMNILQKDSLFKNRHARSSGEYNVKKALQFMGSSSMTIKNDSDRKDSRIVKEKPNWQIQKDALKKKFQGGKWNPPKRLSRQEMESIRLLKSQFPTMSASELASHFKISPEAVRRILKAKWSPKEEDMANIDSRWSRRGERIKELYNKRNNNVVSNEQPNEVITLRYNPSGVAQDYYTRKKTPSHDFKYQRRQSQQPRDIYKTHNKLYLLHKIKD